MQYKNKIKNNTIAILNNNKKKCDQYYDKTLEQKKRDPCLNMNSNKPFSDLLQESLSREEARKFLSNHS